MHKDHHLACNLPNGIKGHWALCRSIIKCLISSSADWLTCMKQEMDKALMDKLQNATNEQTNESKKKINTKK